MLGLRIVERMKREYGEEDEEVPEDVNPFTKKKSVEEKAEEEAVYGERAGFLSQEHKEHLEGVFIRDEEEDKPEHAGGFIVEYGDDSNLQIKRTASESYPQTPISLLSTQHQKITGHESTGADSEEYELDKMGIQALPKVNQGGNRGRGHGRRAGGAGGGRGGIVSRTPQSNRSSKATPKEEYRTSGGNESESSSLSDPTSDVDNSEGGSVPEAAYGNEVEGPIRKKTSADRTTKLTQKRKAAQKCEVAARSH